MWRRLPLSAAKPIRHRGTHLGKLSRLVLLMIYWENLQFKGERVILKALTIAARAFKALQTSDLTLMDLIKGYCYLYCFQMYPFATDNIGH
jgi:hypothetical protein